VSTSQIPGPPPPQPPPQYPPQQQPGWGPYGPQPPPKRHRLRKWLLILTGVTAAFIGVVVALAIGLSSVANHAASPNSAPRPPATAQPSSQPATSNLATPTPSTTQPPSVSQQISDWFNGGGGDQLKAIGTDAGTVSTDMQAYAAGNLQPADGATLQSDDARFQADIQAAQANLPPAGIPGLRTDYNAALTYYNTEATDLDNAVIAANAGDYAGADTDAQAGITAANIANAKLAAANADVTNYTSP
jgi:hypothetical protein